MSKDVLLDKAGPIRKGDYAPVITCLGRNQNKSCGADVISTREEQSENM